MKVTLNSLVFPWAVECFLSFGFLPRSRNLFIYFFKYVRVVQEILVIIHVEVLHSISKKVLSFIHHPPQKNVKNLNVQKFQTPLGKTQKQKTTHKKGKKENMHRSLPALENHHLSAYKNVSLKVAFMYERDGNLSHHQPILHHQTTGRNGYGDAMFKM